jgi:hypothetical protein
MKNGVPQIVIRPNRPVEQALKETTPLQRAIYLPQPREKAEKAGKPEQRGNAKAA